MKCLFVVDVQNGFVSPKTEFVLPRIEKLMSEFREGPIIATKFINWGGPFETIMHWKRLMASPETDLIPFVQEKADYVIDKHIYSSCTEQVLNLLAQFRITEAYIVGIDTDCCVLKTALDLFERNIRPIVLTYYCASNGGSDSHTAAMTVLERNIGEGQIIRGAIPPTDKG